MRLLLVSGGSAGHLAPLVAVGRAFAEMHPEAEMLFLCVDQDADRSFVRKENVRFDVLPLPRRSWTLPMTFVRNFLKSRRILREFQPDIVFSKGGAVSVPCCLAAKRLHIPIVLHESDAVTGRANALVSRWASVVCFGMMEGRETEDGRHESSHRTSHISHLFTGNPIRPELTQGSRAEGLRMTGLSGTKPILLVCGGSQGAQALNEAVALHIDALLPHCEILHLTGKGKTGASLRPGYCSMEFAHDTLKHVYAVADMALCRAGAGTIAELAACSIPAVLVPIAGLANDHQVRNAEAAAASGGCIHLPQQSLRHALVPLLAALVEDEPRRLRMARAMHSLHHPEAARRIAEILSQRIASGARTH